MFEIEKEIERIITNRLNGMPNHEEYMINSTMKVLAVKDIVSLLKKDIKLMAEEISRHIIIVRRQNITMYQCRFCGKITDDYMELEHEPDCVVNIAYKYIGE